MSEHDELVRRLDRIITLLEDLTTGDPGVNFDGDWLDTNDLARLRGTTIAAVYTARNRGQLPPARRVGRRLLWHRTEIQDWLDERPRE